MVQFGDNSCTAAQSSQHILTKITNKDANLVSGLLLGVANSFLHVFLLYHIVNLDGTQRTVSYTTDVILGLVFLSFSCLLIANAYDRHRELAVYWLLGIILVSCVIIMFMIGVMMPKAIHSDLPTKMVGITVSAILTGIALVLFLWEVVESILEELNQGEQQQSTDESKVMVCATKMTVLVLHDVIHV